MSWKERVSFFFSSFFLPSFSLCSSSSVSFSEICSREKHHNNTQTSNLKPQIQIQIQNLTIFSLSFYLFIFSNFILSLSLYTTSFNYLAFWVGFLQVFLIFPIWVLSDSNKNPIFHFPHESFFEEKNQILREGAASPLEIHPKLPSLEIFPSSNFIF